MSINFHKLQGRKAYMSHLENIYNQNNVSWFTPVELFKPWYAHGIAEAFLRTTNLSFPLKIYEIGGGSGTCAKGIMDFIMFNAPTWVYNNMSYTYVPSFSFKSWDVEQQPCWVIMLEVLDNLPHSPVTRNRSGQYARAISIFDQTLREDPTYPEALIGRGTAYAFNRELDSAVADFTKAIQSNPSAGHGLLAIADLSKSLEFEPDSTNILHERGIVNLKVKDFYAATVDLSACVKLDKDNESAYTYLPRLYHQLFQIHHQLFDEIPLRDVSFLKLIIYRLFLQHSGTRYQKKTRAEHGLPLVTINCRNNNKNTFFNFLSKLKKAI
ncbi:hypothetical protein L2E82_14624 [Cichorium intybus]|uniref:Uncharacterized protein n=1 Tax=Cichorium intybus TaxID=13427 RepID=A0ACB9F1D4_CICIN|nr:hypothetical protein L2E82_14624 [Cichorium intybus]